jgi:branched-chain amino acid transport system substrate-binding protein
MKTGIRRRGIAALGASVLLMAGCGSDGDGDSSGGGGEEQELTGEIKLGAPLTLSGAAAFAGLSEQQGMDFAIKQINEEKYLDEATISAEYVDVGLETDQAVAAVRGFATDDSIAAIAGNTLSNHALAIAPVAQQASVPLLVANTGGLDELTTIGDFVYQIDVRQKSYADKMAAELSDRGVTTTAAIVHDDVPAITSLWEAYEEDYFPEADIEVTEVQKTPSTATDYSAAVTSILADDPDAVGIMTRAGTVQIIQALRQGGYQGVIWGQAGLAGGVAANAAPVTEGVLFTANAAAGSDVPSMEEFFTAYEEEYGEQAFAFAAQGYDAVWAAAHAAKNAGCITRECIQEGLTELMDTGFEGALGELTFEDRNAVGPGAIVEIVNGKETFVR